ncbi:MAG: hypothetical protein LDL33_01635 [Desulfomonile sp.]|nr:hypothetical protein [Desulfomonile sp.]
MSDTIDGSRVKPLREVRKEHILHVLRSADGDLDRAGRILGISVASLRRRIKEYGLGGGDKTEKVD